MIRERINAGLARARTQGKRLGRPRVGTDVEARVRELLATGNGVQKSARLAGRGRLDGAAGEAVTDTGRADGAANPHRAEHVEPRHAPGASAPRPDHLCFDERGSPALEANGVSNYPIGVVPLL